VATQIDVGFRPKGTEDTNKVLFGVILGNKAKELGKFNKCCLTYPLDTLIKTIFAKIVA
jgi:hypothetical protein